MRTSSLALHGLLLLVIAARTAPAQDITALEERIKKLESANAKLQQTVEKLTREVELLRKTADSDAPAKKVINKKLAAVKGSDKKPVPEKNVSKKFIEGKTPEKKLPAVKEPVKKPAPGKETIKKPGTVKEPLKKSVPAKETLKELPSNKVDKDELLEKSKTAPEKSGTSVEIPEGKLVATVKTDLHPALNGVLRPEDKVDVYVTYISSDPEGKEGSVQSKTKLILSAVEVFALDAVRDSNSADRDDKKINTVSLLIDAEQAGLLLMAEKKGNLSLALRKK